MNTPNRVFGSSYAPLSDNRSNTWKRVTIHGFYEILRINRTVAAELKALGYSRKDLAAVQVALREALRHAIRYGHIGNTSRAVLLGYHLDPAEALLEVTVEELELNPAPVPSALDEGHLLVSPSAGFSLKRVYLTWIRIARQGRQAPPRKRGPR